VIDVTCDVDGLPVPEGHSIIARQFTAGKPRRTRPISSPGGTIEGVIRAPFSTVPPGRERLFFFLRPSDESLGYCRATLRVENHADISQQDTICVRPYTMVRLLRY